MNEQEYCLKQNAEKERLLKGVFTAPESVDKDIFNLKMILLEIRPYSRWWRRGYVRSLRRAIKALERENKERREKA